MENNQEQQVRFETIKLEEIRYGKNNKKFIEVGKKKCISEKGENEFIQIVLGYYVDDKTKRFSKKNISFPVDPTLAQSIATALQKVVK